MPATGPSCHHQRQPSFDLLRIDACTWAQYTDMLMWLLPHLLAQLRLLSPQLRGDGLALCNSAGGSSGERRSGRQPSSGYNCAALDHTEQQL